MEDSLKGSHTGRCGGAGDDDQRGPGLFAIDGEATNRKDRARGQSACSGDLLQPAPIHRVKGGDIRQGLFTRRERRRLAVYATVYLRTFSSSSSTPSPGPGITST